MIFICFEEDYEEIKNKPNEMWTKYYPQIYKQITFVANKYYINPKELISIAYEKFIISCKEYDPYRNFSFIPFNKYITTIIHYHIHGYLQWETKKYKRDCPALEETHNITDTKDYFKNVIDKQLIKSIYELSNPFQKQIIDLYLKDYYQTEIAKQLNVTQPCISKNLKKIRLAYYNSNKKIYSIYK